MNRVRRAGLPPGPPPLLVEVLVEAEKKQKLEEIPWLEQNGLSLNRRVRMVKMVAPVCQKCSRQRGAWWDRCSHDPYHGLELVDNPETFSADERGLFKVDETDQTKFYRKAPNVRQVGVHERITSKMGVQKQAARGWKLPQELGYKPMCEFRDCYQPSPKVKTEAGAYCNQFHAKAILMKERGITEEVFDKEKRRKQLEAVPLA